MNDQLRALADLEKKPLFRLIGELAEENKRLVKQLQELRAALEERR